MMALLLTELFVPLDGENDSFWPPTPAVRRVAGNPRGLASFMLTTLALPNRKTKRIKKMYSV